MDDVLAGMNDGFAKRLAGLLERHTDLVASLDYMDAFRLGEQGADAALAPLIWSAAIGERWSTTIVTEFLHVSRQALHKRVANGTALGLPGKGTTWFPVWQFDRDGHQVRPVVGEIIQAFRDELGPVDPFLIASWATTEQRELGMSPEAWLEAENDPQELVRVARRAAHKVAR